MTVAVGPVQVSDKVALMVAAGVVVLVIGGVWYVKYKVGQAAEAVNPLNPNNVINKSVTGVLQPALGTNQLTGQKNTIGSWLYFATH